MHRNPTPHTWPKSSLFRYMHWNPIPYTWMHQNHHPSSKCTRILPLTNKCTENRHSSGKCTNILFIDILPLIHENTAIIIPQVNKKEFPSHMNAPTSSSLRCTGISPLIHKCTKIVNPQVIAPESYPPHMNAPKTSFLMWMHRYPTPHTWMHLNHHPSRKCTGIWPLTHECTANHHSSSKCTDILPLTHECTDIITPQVNAPESYPSHMNALQSSLLR